MERTTPEVVAFPLIRFYYYPTGVLAGAAAPRFRPQPCDPPTTRAMKRRNDIDLKELIRTIPDYPHDGIQFRDITTLLANARGFRAAVDELVWPFLDADIAFVAGIEARGFILGGAVAHELGCGFIPLRKKGKLPGQVIAQEYTLEYGADTIEVHADAISNGDRILLVDDLIATGGTAEAAAELVHRSGGELVAAAFVIDLPELGGTRTLLDAGLKVHSLVEFEGA